MNFIFFNQIHFYRSTFFIGVFLLLLTVLGSCSSKKDIYYFQDKSQIAGTVDFEVNKIQMNDILSIRVVTDDPVAAAVFNLDPFTGGGNAMQGANIQLMGYLVSNTGGINFPRLGDVQVTDFTVTELESYLVKRLKEEGYLKQPIVIVRVLNNKFTVLGEVARPGTFTYAEQVITLPQALGMAGDLTISGNRNDIVLIRELDGNRTYTQIDLTKTDWYASDYYYIRQNDVLYVSPNNPRVKNAGYIPNFGTLLGVASFLLTIILLVRQ
jgi:polysaccharide export outer membrane protein